MLSKMVDFGRWRSFSRQRNVRCLLEVMAMGSFLLVVICQPYVGVEGGNVEDFDFQEMR